MQTSPHRNPDAALTHPSSSQIVRSPFPRSSSTSSGLALVVVLFAVALVSIVVLAYFNLALLNRNTSFSSAGEARANILALSALNFIKGDFISEIQAGSILESDSSGVPIYLPATNATMLPFRMTTNIAYNSAIPANLIKWSSGSIAFWTNTPSYGSAAGPKRGYTGISTGNASVNGHYVGAARWIKPDFNNGSAFPSTIIPEWVFMTRQGPLTNTATPIATLANSAANNSSYVIGRYAYTVYDEGGLIDIIAAGYSPTTFPNPVTADIARKGSQGFADLSQLGLTQAQIDQLGGWRNATSWTSANAYTNYLLTNAPVTGFMQPAPGDQTFLSRQDLINYWTTQLSANAGLLTNLTTFSREKNAPSWFPEHDAKDNSSSTYWNGVVTDTVYDAVTYNDPAGGISYGYYSSKDMAASNNRFFPNVRARTPFTRLSKEVAVVGEPLVKNRFDLNKLSWISYTGKAPGGVTYPDIYNYFGLTPNFGPSGAFLSWTYNHTGSTYTPPSNGVLAPDTDHIKTLDEVAAANREPDFFELLQAGILRGSLGLSSGDPTPPMVDSNTATGGEFYRAAISPPKWPVDQGGALYRPMRLDTSGTLHAVNAQPMDQVIQIGANMIDQADTDNFPTEIILDGDHFYGVENLPYISGIGDAALRVADTTATAPAMTYDITSATDTTISGKTLNQAYVHRWLDFALWNPNQNATIYPSGANGGPTDVRICVVQGQEYPYLTTLPKNPVSGPAPVAGTDFSGRIFEVPPTTAFGMGSGTVVVASANSPTYADGTAWIGFKLSDYNNFPEPTALNYAKTYTSDTANPAASNINDPDGRVQTTPTGGATGWQRAGVYLGWSLSPDNPYKVPACASRYPGYNTATPPAGMPALALHSISMNCATPFTIYLQYEDPNHAGSWHTYEELHNLYYMRASTGDTYMEPGDTSWSEWLTGVPFGTAQTVVQTLYPGYLSTYNGSLQTNMDGAVLIPLDPRTLRQNIFTLHNTIGWGRTGGSGADFTVTSTVNMVGEPSKGISTGPHFQNPANLTDATWSGAAQTWVDNISISPMKNWDPNVSGADPTSYYRDRDMIARVGDAAGWTNVVVPTDASSETNRGATPLIPGSQMQRPLHLDRPFRSVGELGYVYRDDPWKTLNLISANSGDSALLDTFYIGPTTNTASPTLPPPDLIAGKMNINSAALNVIAAGNSPATSPVLQALVSQAVRDYQSASGNPSTLDTGLTTASDIQALSTNIVNCVRVNGPFMNVSDLPKIFPQVTGTTSAVPVPLYTGLKHPSEALIRALTDSSGTRTWNLMIDVVAQAGKFNPTAANMNNFTVEGEKHFWLHVAIDRFTGEIVDQQLEPVWE